MALKRLALAAGLLVQISACTTLSAETHGLPLPDGSEALTEAPTALESTKTEAPMFYWPWNKTTGAKPPPVKPYRLPTMAGDGLNFKAAPAGLVKAPSLDADALYEYVVECFPEKSKWKLDVALRGQLAHRNAAEVTDLNAGNTSIGSSYVAIVANMPLYSSTELNREKEREHQRRQDAATTVASFISTLASRNHAVRELALYRSLEARAALRVQQGIAGAAEQVKYLEKVANSQTDLVKQQAAIMQTRLKLTAMCDPENGKNLNQWLKTVSTLPMASTARRQQAAK